MSELISRQAAIDYFVTNVGFNDEDGYPIEDECELRKIWTDIIEGIPPATGVISRQEAIETILGQPPEPHYPSWYAEQIMQMPPAEPKIIRCGDCVNCRDSRCTVANHHVGENDNCISIFGAKRRTK